MNDVIRAIKASARVLVASHVNPDGDAVGSLLASGLALRSMGKDVFMYNESPIPAVYRFLDTVDTIGRTLDTDFKCDTAIILDCGTPERIGKVCNRLEGIPVVINIDHHLTNTGFGDLQLVDHQACATAEIVYRLISRLKVAIDTSIAAAIYTGILTDTGSFRFSNTNAAAFAICNEMVRLGVDPYMVARHVYGTYSLGRIKLLNLALDSIEIWCNGKLSIMTLTRDMMKKTGTQPEDADGLINYARRIEDVQVAALIHELDGSVASAGNGFKSRFHVSLRSDGDVDVSRIAAAFGGGGHESAAGFSIETNLADLKARLIELTGKIPQICAPN